MNSAKFDTFNKWVQNFIENFKSQLFFVFREILRFFEKFLPFLFLTCNGCFMSISGARLSGDSDLDSVVTIFVSVVSEVT